MSLYIIRPKASSVPNSVNLSSVKFTPESRNAQIETVTHLNEQQPIYREIRSWIEDVQNTDEPQILKSKPGITGTVITEIANEEVARLLEELPVDVLPNEPLELIRPVPDEKTAKNQVAGDDLWHLEAIGLLEARKSGFIATGEGISIAVLDTGVDESHPEITGKVDKVYDLRNGQPFLMNQSQDPDGHGTHVAGLICGKNVGVAPGVKIINGMLLPGGLIDLVPFTLVIEWLARQPEIAIINLSAGIPGYCRQRGEILASLYDVGILPVCAIGNDGRNTHRLPGNYPGVISVGATNRQNLVATFSGSGTVPHYYVQHQVPYLVAPGEAVYSCIKDGGYEAWNGTSMAAPIVSGTAALILEEYPQLSALELREELFRRCQSLAKELQDRQGYGLIQVKYET